MLLTVLLLIMPVGTSVDKPGLEKLFVLGRNGICPVAGETPAGFSAMGRASYYLTLPDGRRVPLKKQRERKEAATINTIRLTLPVGMTWHGLSVVRATVITTAIDEGDSWEKYRLDFSSSKEAVTKALLTAGHRLGPVGTRKFNDDEVVPYGATETIAERGAGSSLICTTDG